MRRHGRMLLGLLAVLALTLSTVLTAHAATRLKIDVRMDHSFRVEIAGSLTDGPHSVKRAQVRATIDGRTMAEDRTRGNGRFALSFTVPANLRSGQQRLTVSFDGDRKHDAASASVVLQFPSSPGRGRDDPPGQRPRPVPTTQPPRAPRPAPSQPANDPTTPAAAAPSASQSASPTPDPAPELTAEADDTTPANGAVVSITGALTLPDGRVLGGAGIEVHGPDGEIEEAFTLTADDGTFTTFHEIPVDHQGPLELTVRSTADGGFRAAQATVALDVQHRAVSTATASASPTPSPSASPSAVAAPPSPSPTPDQLTQAVPPAPTTTATPGMPSWMLATLLGVGGTACAVAAAVMVGAARHHRASATDLGLEVFEDDAPKRAL